MTSRLGCHVNDDNASDDREREGAQGLTYQHNWTMEQRRGRRGKAASMAPTAPDLGETKTEEEGEKKGKKGEIGCFSSRRG